MRLQIGTKESLERLRRHDHYNGIKSWDPMLGGGGELIEWEPEPNPSASQVLNTATDALLAICLANQRHIQLSSRNINSHGLYGSEDRQVKKTGCSMAFVSGRRRV
jgi:hypothetical protein